MSKIQKALWAIGILCVIGFSVITIGIHMGYIQILDDAIYNAIANIMNPTLTKIVKAITFLAEPITVITIALLCIIFVKRKAYKIIIPLNLLLISSINYGIKYLIQRPRPEILRLIEETGFSFPSGHTATATAFYGFFIYLFVKYIPRGWKKNMLIAVTSLVIVAIGASRIYLGVHYASDVIGAMLFGIFYLILFIPLMNKVMTKRR